MISNRHKCIFVHIPRTAGTSIENAMGVDMDRVGPHSRKVRSAKHSIKHIRASEIRAEVGADIWDSYFKFSFIRNPWDRVISLYHQPSFRNISHRGLKYFLERYKPFYHEHGVTCNDYLDYGDMDFIGRFESLKSDLKFISDKLCIKIRKHLRATERQADYAGYYNKETREMVEGLFEKDIKRFGYEF